MGEITTKEALDVLKERGYLLWKEPKTVETTFKVDMSRFKGRKVRVGIVSDTHLGSKYQQLSYLKAFYRYCVRRKVPVVLHGGDLLDGNGKVYRGQIYEQFVIGATPQIQYAANNYPRHESITTYLIGGNHCASWQSSEGLDALGMLSKDRPDIKNLGYYGATVDIGGIQVYLMHGGGGVAYARSYKMQKIIEQFPGGQKPQILIIGHWHITDILPTYRNVVGILPGCFQSQTPYLRRKGLSPDIGGFILEFEVADVDKENGLVGCKIEWRPFPVAKEHDY